MTNPTTLFDKLWNSHIVHQEPGYPAVLYIDAHLTHEVTSPQAYDGLRARHLPVFRTNRTWATMDHNIPTQDQDQPIREPLSAKQVQKLVTNCAEFGVRLYGIGHPYQGIVHVIGPELGITQPGMTIVCGDSHTSTHGAFGSIAFGIGTSEVEQVLASQTILQTKPKTMNIRIDGKLGKGVTSKDLILSIIAQISTSGGTGYFVEYSGSVIEDLSMEARMTICNMSIEMGARGGLIAPDQTTFDYVHGREFAPKGAAWDKAVAHWRTLRTDPGAIYDKQLVIDGSSIEPMITYGTNPAMGMGITDSIPTSSSFESDNQRDNFLGALNYMGLAERQGKPLLGHPVDYVFLGSCTNARIEDFRAIAQVVHGHKKAANVHVFVVPGSAQVAKELASEGLAEIFSDAGFDVRDAGCSACLGMNEDKIPPDKYCVSTSNRNFQGRQGQGARTFLASPITAAAAAITGKVADVREYI
jgi:3-isopropylmalate/(R)-2-methylmalate dehydratase large subunit